MNSKLKFELSGEGLGQVDCVAGRKTRFDITARDIATGVASECNEPTVTVTSCRSGLEMPCFVACKDAGHYRVTYEAKEVDELEVRVVVDGVAIHDEPFKVTVRATDASVAHVDVNQCVVRGDGVREVVCGATARFDVELRDRDGTLVRVPPGINVDFFGLLECHDCDDVDIDSVLGANGDRATFACSFEAPNTPGERLLHLTVGESVPIAASPYRVRFVPAEAVGRTSFLKPSFPSSPELSLAASATLVSCDAFGNCQIRGGAKVDVSATVSDGRDTDDCAVVVRDLANGSYHIASTANKLGAMRIAVFVNGEPIQRSPFDLIVVKAATGARRTEAGTAALRLSVSLAEARDKRMAALSEGEDGEEEWRRSTAGNMAVHDAALVGNLGAVKQLIEELATESVDVLNDDNRTPLYLACWAGQRAVAEWLVEQGADVNRRTRQGYSPIFACAERDHLSVVELLLSCAQTNSNALADDGTSALYHAAAKGCARIVRFMCLHGAQANAGKEGSWKPIHGAVFKTRPDVVRVLVDPDVHCDINAAQTKSLKGYTPLHLAVSRAQPFSEAITLLLERVDLAIDAKSANGQTALHLAAMWGHSDVCAQLVARGASLSARNNKTRTPLDMALKEQKVETAAYLRRAMGLPEADGDDAAALLSPRRTALRKVEAPQSPGDIVQLELEGAAKRRAKSKEKERES